MILPIGRVARIRPASVTLHFYGRLAFRCGLLSGFEGRDRLEAGMRPLGTRREWLYAFGDKFIDFLKTDFFKGSVLAHAGTFLVVFYHPVSTGLQDQRQGIKKAPRT